MIFFILRIEYLPDMPKHYRPVRPAAAEQPFVARVPCNARGLFFMPSERLHFLAQISQVEQL